MNLVKTVRAGVLRGDLHNQRQYALHPRRFPGAAGREDVLHVDRQVHGAGDRFNPRSNCHGTWVPPFWVSAASDTSN
jgi:hypothetical protein